MRSRTPQGGSAMLGLAVLVAAVLASAPSALALERVSVPVSESPDHGDWAASARCTLSYFNACTGWMWTWSGWLHTERVAMTIDTCCPENASARLTSASLYAWHGAPSGYGFTGTLSVYQLDSAGCLATPLGAQPLLPSTGDNITSWSLTAHGRDLALVYEHAGATSPDPTVWVSDHPAAGPTGPAACGTCYPSVRVGHGYLFGVANSPLCPGSVLHDGVCAAEWRWGAEFSCADGGVAVSPRSWSAIKSLYR